MASLENCLTVHEAAKLAGYHANHIRRLARAGKIGARKWGTTWMVDRELLQSYLAKVQDSGSKTGPKPKK
jgi:excisionase family DNA binding protein